MSLILTLVLVFVLYPPLCIVVYNPLLPFSKTDCHRRTTLRDLLRLYQSLILSVFVVLPLWMHFVIDEYDENTDGGYYDTDRHYSSLYLSFSYGGMNTEYASKQRQQTTTFGRIHGIILHCRHVLKRRANVVGQLSCDVS
jgi:hypothetical protein